MKVVLVFLLCALLSACTGKATALTPQILETSTAEISTPTRVPTPLQPSPTFTSTLQPTFTPTSTPRPSLTPAISPTTRPFPVKFFAKLTEQALEIGATQTQIASFPISCDERRRYNISLSPSGNWLSIHCGYVNNPTLEIVRKDGKQWILQFKDYLAKEEIKDGWTPVGGLYLAHWTNDEKYLYFTSQIGFSVGDHCVYGNWVQGLYRIDLNTGAVSATLPYIPSFDGYEIAFSPGGRRLAYTYYMRHAVIHDLRTGEDFTIETGIETGGGAVGDITWSPDGSELAYSTCKTNQGYAIVKSTIQIYSLETHGSKTILEVEKYFLSIEKWDGNQILRINGYNRETDQTTYWFFDWSSGKLSTTTPTPQ